MKSISLSKLKCVNLEEGCVGTIIHIGAGNANEVKDYLSYKPEQIVLLEPAPKLHKKLQQKFKAEASVSVLKQALAAESGNQILHLSQPIRFSSLSKPNKLHEIFPNLSVSDEVEVETTSFDDLVENLDLNEDKKNILIMQANGGELPALQHSDFDNLKCFSKVIIQCAADATYCEQGASQKLTELLIAKGLKLDFKEKGDAVFTDFIFSKDENKIRIKNLEEELKGLRSNNKKALDEHAKLDANYKALEEKNKSLRSDKDSLNTENQAAQKQNNELIALNKSQLENITNLEALSASANNGSEQLKNEKESLVKEKTELGAIVDNWQKKHAELEQNNKKLREAKAAVEKEKATLVEEKKDLEQKNSQLIEQKAKREKENQDLLAQVDKQNAQINDLKSKVNKLDTENSESSKRYEISEKSLKSKQEQCESLKQQLNEREKELSQLQSELRESNKSNLLVSKLLTKTQVDNDDLRASYEAKLESEKTLIELIKELRQKLEIASSFYHNLQNEHPELIS